jgi:transcriptional regulator with AAA-type ATPase domain/tetratricopeptide (TPR) repeat protein
MRDPIRPETSFQGRQFPRDGTKGGQPEEGVDLGDLCLSVGNLSDALAYYKGALGKVSNTEPRVRCDIVLKIVDCLRRQSKHEDALDFLEELMEGFDGMEKRDLLAEKATLLCLLGRYGEAAEVCNSVKAQEHSGQRKGDARIYLVLGHVLLRVCKWREAVVCFEQAATFARMCGDLACLGNSLNNLGIAYKNLCRFDVSARYLEKAVSAARREKNKASLAVRLLNLANTALKAGNLVRARSAISESLEIAETLNLTRLKTLGVIASSRIDMLAGDYSKAGEVLRGAITEAEDLEDPRSRAVAEETLGELLTLTGDLSGARRVLTRCAESMPSQCRDVDAEVKSRLADLHLAEGDHRTALRRSKEAMKIARGIGDEFEVGRCMRTAALTREDRALKIAGLREAERLFTKIGSVAEASQTAHLMAKVGMRGAEGGRDIMSRLERALSGFDTCGLKRKVVGVLCDLVLVSLDAGRYDGAVAYMERAEKLSGDARCQHPAIPDVRRTLDSKLSRTLVTSDWKAPGSIAEAHVHLSSWAGISGLILTAIDSGGRTDVVEALGMDMESARVMGERLGKSVTSATFMSAPAAFLKEDCLPGVKAALALPIGAGGSGGLLILTWDAGGVSSPDGSNLVRASCECRRLMPLFRSALPAGEEKIIPVCMCGIISADRKMKEVLFSLHRISESSANVLITGDTGTGKELVARAVHLLSARSSGPFVAQNCAALPEQLLESELFGHKAGAFTGAKADKRGLLEAAHGGVFFLDEIGDVSPLIQAKMLRAVETGEIRRVGDTTPRQIDVRFVSATNKRLEEQVAQGKMREDLYYRLNVVRISLPPLREREADIGLLSRLFLRRFSKALGRKIPGIEDDAMNALLGFDWPGNVRQLENEIERAVTFTVPGKPVTREVLSASVRGSGGRARPTLRAEVRAVERRRILAALRQYGWNKTHTARALGDISRPALIAKMKKLGIPLSHPRD